MRMLNAKAQRHKDARDQFSNFASLRLRVFAFVSRRGNRNGAILLEVVLALVLLAFAAAVIGGGLHTAIGSVERLRLNAHATDLAVSVVSELQMGTKALGLEGPQRFEWPFEFWTWEAIATSSDEPGKDTGRTRKVEVIIRHDDEPPITHRLAQVIRLPEIKEEVLFP